MSDTATDSTKLNDHINNHMNIFLKPENNIKTDFTDYGPIMCAHINAYYMIIKKIVDRFWKPYNPDYSLYDDYYQKLGDAQRNLINRSTNRIIGLGGSLSNEQLFSAYKEAVCNNSDNPKIQKILLEAFEKKEKNDINDETYMNYLPKSNGESCYGDKYTPVHDK